MHTYTANGLKLAYERLGSGTPMVLIHGYPFDHRIWESVAQLLKASADLIMPDLRGFGASEAAEPGFGVEAMAADLAALLDHIGIEGAVIVGHSMGGFISAAFAQRWPKRVLGLALVASQIGLDTPEKLQSRHAVVARVKSEGVTPVAEAMPSILSPNAGVREGLRGLILEQTSQAVLGSQMAMITRPDYLGLLEEFSFPILMISGLADAIITPDQFHLMKSKARHSQLVELSGVGHMPMLEAPRETAEALLTLVQR